MNALIRQIVVLSVLWAVCEMLLPNGSQQHFVRMTVSVLVMTALLSTAGELLRTEPKISPVLAQQAVQTSADSYRTAVLRSAANQAASYCRRLAERAGYEAQVSAFLTQDGQLERIDLELTERAPLLSDQKLAQTIAEQFKIHPDKIRLSMLQEVAP